MLVYATLTRGPSAIVLARNHLTGLPSPSRADSQLTHALVGSRHDGSRALDHLVIGPDVVFSMPGADPR
jgi:DNA repair protein RadC